MAINWLYYDCTILPFIALVLKNIVNSTNRLIKYPESGKLENFKLNDISEFRSVKFKSYKLIYSS